MNVIKCQHNEGCDNFCLKCNILLCNDCLRKHNDHKVTKITFEQLLKDRKKIDTQISSVQRNEKNYKEFNNLIKKFRFWIKKTSTVLNNHENNTLEKLSISISQLNRLMFLMKKDENKGEKIISEMNEATIKKNINDWHKGFLLKKEFKANISHDTLQNIARDIKNLMIETEREKRHKAFNNLLRFINFLDTERKNINFSQIKSGKCEIKKLEMSLNSFQAKLEEKNKILINLKNELIKLKERQPDFLKNATNNYQKQNDAIKTIIQLELSENYGKNEKEYLNKCYKNLSNSEMLNDPNFDYLSNYDSMKILGEGTIGVTSVIRDNGELYAAKVINCGDLILGEDIYNIRLINSVIQAHIQLNHKNVNKIRRMFFDVEVKALSIISDYCKGIENSVYFCF